jgi:hypothetical protein
MAVDIDLLRKTGFNLDLRAQHNYSGDTKIAKKTSEERRHAGFGVALRISWKRSGSRHVLVNTQLDPAPFSRDAMASMRKNLDSTRIEEWIREQLTCRDAEEQNAYLFNRLQGTSISNFNKNNTKVDQLEPFKDLTKGNQGSSQVSSR